MTGSEKLKIPDLTPSLEQIYEDRRLHEQEAEGLPRIICSEAFV